MSKLNDLTGRRFGKLIVKERMHSNKYGHPFWRAECDCSGEIITDGITLKNGYTKSCGCIKRESAAINGRTKALPIGESNFNTLFRTYNNTARRRNLIFELTEEQFRCLTKAKCFYCNCDPGTKYKVKGHNGIYVYNGIDRWNNSLGYTVENSVSCCRRCNWMKHAQSAKDFIEACQRISDHQQSKTPRGIAADI